MKNRLMLLLMTLLMLMAVPALADMQYIDGATADRVHLRQSPSEGAASLGLYFTGTPVERLAMADNGFSRVRIGTETGYVRTEFLAPTAEPVCITCVVDNPTSDWVNLRSGASFQAEPVGRLENGDVVTLMGETASGWSYVEVGGVRGYVVTEFLRVASYTAAPETEAYTQIVGTTAEGGYIHALDTGDGYVVYFVAAEEHPIVAREDVNFDGRADLVVTTVRGATNFYYEFFVWTGRGYVRAEYPGVEGIANYSLRPEQGYVYSSANGGNAGSAYVDCIFRWDGTQLRLVRCARSEGLREYRSEGTSFVTVLHDRKLELNIYDYTAGDGGVLIYSEIIDMNSMDTDKLEEMKQRLWMGL